MPPEVFLTYAKDYRMKPQQSMSQSEGYVTKLVDVNTFNNFHTFQIEKPQKKDQTEWYEPSSLSTRFKVPKGSGSGDGLIFRMRSELSSAFSDKVQQGMRVTLMEESSGILVDGSSIDNNEGSVVLQYDGLQEEKDYLIRYDLYDTEISISDKDLATSSFSGSHIKCNMPFITQQLLIMDKRLVQQRINTYLNDKDLQTQVDLTKDGLKCDFGALNNSESLFSFMNIEAILFCEQRTYSYQLSTKKVSDYTLLYNQEFQVQGLNTTGRTLITYWFEMTIGINFMASNGLKVLLSRSDYAFNEENPDFTCLYDRSCILAHMNQKNMLKIEAILTSGKYKISIFEYNTLSKSSENQLESIKSLPKPVSIKIQANSIIQNEERQESKWYIIVIYFQSQLPLYVS